MEGSGTHAGQVPRRPMEGSGAQAGKPSDLWSGQESLTKAQTTDLWKGPQGSRLRPLVGSGLIQLRRLVGSDLLLVAHGEDGGAEARAILQTWARFAPGLFPVTGSLMRPDSLSAIIYIVEQR